VRILAIDLGEKRVGLALSDELEIAASPLAIIDFKDSSSLLDQLCEIIKRKIVKTVVIGLPLNMDGSRGEKAREAEAFAESLKTATDIPVILWDERLTSRQAQRVLLEGGVSRTQRKRTTDKVAAAVLLQSYLDSKAASR
jgi:putative Holliday junction resolvase